MKRPTTLLLIALYVLVLLVLGAAAAAPPENPFSRYADFLPGQLKPVGGECASEYMYITNGDSCWYSLADRVSVTVNIQSGRIRMAWFRFTASTLKLGDLVGWYGKWSYEGRYHVRFEGGVAAVCSGHHLGLQTKIFAVIFYAEYRQPSTT